MGSSYRCRGPASAATGTQSFRFLFRGDPQAGAVGTVVATGVINGVGTDRAVSFTPNPDGTVTDTDVVTLPAGTLTIHDTDTTTTFTLDRRAASAGSAGAGPTRS